VRRNLVGWLRERTKKEDDAAPAAIRLALRDAEGENQLALEELERFMLARSLRVENPSWFIDPDKVPAPITTEQVVRAGSLVQSETECPSPDSPSQRPECRETKPDDAKGGTHPDR